MERIAWIGLDRQYGCEVSPMIVELKSGGFLRAQTRERGPPLAYASINVEIIFNGLFISLFGALLIGTRKLLYLQRFSLYFPPGNFQCQWSGICHTHT